MKTDEPYIIILNWNGKQDTLDCLESLSHLQTPHQVIVVDNGSTDDSVQAIGAACFPQFLLLRQGKTSGMLKEIISESVKLSSVELPTC